MHSLASHEPNPVSSNISLIESAQLLQFLQNEGTLNLDDVRNAMNKKKQETLLAKHKEKIFQGTSDGRWRTCVYDPTKKNKRRQIAKTHYEDLISALVEYYETAEQKTNFNHLTLRLIFPEWINYKNLQGTSSYARRLRTDWEKYYENDSIVDVPVKDLTFITLNEWAHQLVKNNSLSHKQYSNISTIIKQELDYVSEKYPTQLPENLFRRVSINKRLFRKVQKPDDKTQIFSPSEEQAMYNLALKHYDNNPQAKSALAVALNFHLGLRVSELISLCWNDIHKNEVGYFIHVQRIQVATYDTLEDGNVVSNKTQVVERTKSFAGDRHLYLTEEALNVLSRLRPLQDISSTANDYIFTNCYGKAISASAVTKRLNTLCDELGIPRRSNHKIRKTYLTKLFDSGMNLNEIRRIAGHEDSKTFFQNYCFNRHTSHENAKLLESLSLCKQV